MAKPMATNDNKIMYIIAYLIPILTGLLVYILYADKDKSLKFHGIQAIIYGIFLLVLFAILSGGGIFFVFVPLYSGIIGILDLLFWLYGLYIGYQAFIGKPAMMPVIGEWAQKA